MSSGAKVVAVVEGESRGPKIRVFKKKRRKGMRRTRGHRSILHPPARERDSWCSHGTQKRTGQLPQRPRQQLAAAGRQEVDGNVVTGGSILVRQRGRRFRPGLNVGLGKDDTLFAKVAGRVKFEDHGARGRYISVHPGRVGMATSRTVRHPGAAVRGCLRQAQRGRSGPTGRTSRVSERVEGQAAAPPIPHHPHVR